MADEAWAVQHGRVVLQRWREHPHGRESKRQPDGFSRCQDHPQRGQNQDQGALAVAGSLMSGVSL